MKVTEAVSPCVAVAGVLSFVVFTILLGLGCNHKYNVRPEPHTDVGRLYARFEAHVSNEEYEEAYELLCERDQELLVRRNRIVSFFSDFYDLPPDDQKVRIMAVELLMRSLLSDFLEEGEIILPILLTEESPTHFFVKLKLDEESSDLFTFLCRDEGDAGLRIKLSKP